MVIPVNVTIVVPGVYFSVDLWPDDLGALLLLGDADLGHRGDVADLATVEDGEQLLGAGPESSQSHSLSDLLARLDAGFAGEVNNILLWHWFMNSALIIFFFKYSRSIFTNLRKEATPTNIMLQK